MSQAAPRLDADQEQVAQAICTRSRGVVIVSAVAGSGKTTAVVEGVARAVEGAFDPSEVLVTTFTADAGQEVQERLARRVPPARLLGLSVGTMHSVALTALRAAQPGVWSLGKCVDVPRRDDGVPSTWDIWRSILKWSRNGVLGLGIPHLRVSEDDSVELDEYMGFASWVAYNSLTPDSEEAKVEEKRRKLKHGREAVRYYADAKRALGVWDFGDAMTAFTELAAAPNGPRWPLVVVDESQDNDPQQHKLVRLLAQGGLLVLVGQGAQAIYSWRGAAPELFVGEPNARRLELRYNYRSRPKIVELGNAVVQLLDDDFQSSPAIPTRGGSGLVRFSIYADPVQEAFTTCARIKEDVVAGSAPHEHAVLCRSATVAAYYEAAALHYQLPVVRVGAEPFWLRRDVSAWIAYAVLAEVDAWQSFEIVLNMPSRKIAHSALEGVHANVKRGQSIAQACRTHSVNLKGPGREGLRLLGDLLLKHRTTPWPASAELIAKLLSAQRNPSAPDDDSPQGVSRTVLDIAKRFPSALEFARYAAAAAANADKVSEAKAKRTTGKVVISTVHRAKGLEWPNVYLSLARDVFPHAKSATKAQIAEEARLLYVAVTRARDALYISAPETTEGGKARGPSRFYTYLQGKADGR